MGGVTDGEKLELDRCGTLNQCESASSVRVQLTATGDLLSHLLHACGGPNIAKLAKVLCLSVPSAGLSKLRTSGAPELCPHCKVSVQDSTRRKLKAAAVVAN